MAEITEKFLGFAVAEANAQGRREMALGIWPTVESLPEIDSEPQGEYYAVDFTIMDQAAHECGIGALADMGGFPFARKGATIYARKGAKDATQERLKQESHQPEHQD